MSWKGVHVQDYKFDYVDETEFIDNSIWTKLSYAAVFLFTLQDVMIYMADLGSVGLLLGLNFGALENFGRPDAEYKFSNVEEFNVLVKESPYIQGIGGLSVLFILIMSSLLFSFILLYFEWQKAAKIIESRDISYAFTSVVAYRYYAIRSYAHFCLFSQIQNSRKTVDVLAFWVFFEFKDWKRLILAQFPRQFLQAVIVSAIFNSIYTTTNRNVFASIRVIFGGNSLKTESKLLLLLQIFTISSWIISFVSLVVAFFIYIPLVSFWIRGNLKEYCVRKIDKRIHELLKKKIRKKLRKQEREKSEGSSYNRMPTLPSTNFEMNNRNGHSQFGHLNVPSNYSFSDYASEHGFDQRSYGYTIDPIERYGYPPYPYAGSVVSQHNYQLNEYWGGETGFVLESNPNNLSGRSMYDQIVPSRQNTFQSPSASIPQSRRGSQFSDSISQRY